MPYMRPQGARLVGDDRCTLPCTVGSMSVRTLPVIRGPDMHRSIFSGLVLVVITTTALAADVATAPVPIRAPAEIAAAGRINTDISAISQAVGACAAASPSPAGCVCRFPEKLQALRSSYAAALERSRGGGRGPSPGRTPRATRRSCWRSMHWSSSSRLAASRRGPQFRW